MISSEGQVDRHQMKSLHTSDREAPHGAVAHAKLRIEETKDQRKGLRPPWVTEDAATLTVAKSNSGAAPKTRPAQHGPITAVTTQKKC